MEGVNTDGDRAQVQPVNGARVLVVDLSLIHI